MTSYQLMKQRYASNKEKAKQDAMPCFFSTNIFKAKDALASVLIHKRHSTFYFIPCVPEAVIDPVTSAFNFVNPQTVLIAQPGEMEQANLSSLIISMLMISILPHSECQQQHCAFTDTGPSMVRAGYWFSQYNHYSPASSINSSLYTHLYYYSLSLDDVNFGIVVPPDQLPLLGAFSSTVKSNNPSLKALLSIATKDHQESASCAAFSTMAADPVLRASFINSTLELARANKFDGLDLAWQYPSLPSDMINLGFLLAEWRARISEEARSAGSTLLLTATVYFSNHLFDEPTDSLDYPTDAFSDNLDWINALCFGYHKNNHATVNNAALFDKTSHFSTSYGITSWLDAGIPPCKLVMGIPLFGRSWFLKNKAKNELGAAVVATGPRQKMSNQTGAMAYSEIEELLKDPSSEYVYDNRTGTSYVHCGDLWVSFDSPEVVEDKINFAQHSRLLGYFLWPISFDNLNYTTSRQASEMWLRNYESPNYKREEGFEQGLSPLEAPQDDAPTASTAQSGSTQRFSMIHKIIRVCIWLLCFILI
ncbi:hypothetical protein Cni_G11227 [Canna indica]|uniref:GH18 domain-containing protein n=1 Tax=Canna indica TaxID=4628 RepID=A0AAQ3K5N4_9LILI|nr:hypothetical protein Cni_G11227 [Canna indica]